MRAAASRGTRGEPDGAPAARLMALPTASKRRRTSNVSAVAASTRVPPPTGAAPPGVPCPARRSALFP
eukprot:1195955-Prorocentrum_minimum.AAC.2